MPTKSRYQPPQYPEEQVRKRAEQIAARMMELHHLPVRPQDLQRVERWYYETRTGQWTVRYAWELTLDGVIGEVAGELVSPVTPKKPAGMKDWEVAMADLKRQGEEARRQKEAECSRGPKPKG